MLKQPVVELKLRALWIMLGNFGILLRMDFLDPKKRKAHKIRLYVGYGLLALLVLTVTTLLVFQAYGFNFNPRTGEITQNGLLFVDAHPESAEVILNGQSKGNTDQRLVMPADNYSLELRRSGYRTWKRDFLLEGGHIERFVYPFLFPEKLETTVNQLYGATPTFATQSPDRRWLMVQQPSSLTKFDLIDLNAETPAARELSLPTNLLRSSGTVHNLELVEWADDNRHLMIKHTFVSGTEFILIDREIPAESINLNVIFPNAGFTGIALKDKKYDRYYMHSTTSRILSSAVLQTREITTVLNGVIQYRSHGDDVVLFIKVSDSDPAKVTAAVFDDGEVFSLRDFAAGDTYLLDVASFDGRWYMSVGAVSENKTYIYRNAVDILRRSAKLIPAATLRTPGAEFVSFSTNARFIAVQSGSKFAVYDAETDRVHLYDTGLAIDKGQRAPWMDGHRLTLVSGGKLQVFDFDGTNKQELLAAYPNITPFFHQDYDALFTISPAPNLENRSALLSTSLVASSQ